MEYRIKNFKRTIGEILEWSMNNLGELGSVQAEQVYIEIPNIGIQPYHKEFIRAVLGENWARIPQRIKNNITIHYLHA